MATIVALDLETTGLDVTKERIIEIAFILYDLDAGREIARYRRMVNPQKPIPKKITAITGYGDADVMGAPTFKEIAPLVSKMLSRADYIMGHNIRGYDVPLLLHNMIHVGVEVTGFPEIIDTTDARWASADGKIPNLQELCYALDTDYDKALAHTAIYDVSVNLKAYLRGLEIGAFTLPRKETTSS